MAHKNRQTARKKLSPRESRSKKNLEKAGIKDTQRFGGTGDNVAREAPKEKKKPDTINLKAPEKTGKQKLIKGLSTSAVVLGGTLAALTGVGAATGAIGAGAAAAGVGGAAARGGSAVITRTAFQGAKSTFTQRAFQVGKPAASGVDKVFSGTRQVASRFASNTKSGALTKGFMVKFGLTLGAASIAKDIIGTYPFAGFLKEEAVQTVGFPISKAIEAGNFEDAQRLLDFSNELVNSGMESKIPYLNVQKSLNKYFEAQSEANIVWQNLITSAGEENEKLAAGEDDFSVRQREREIESKKRDIRESEVFRLRREGKFDEADELEAEILTELEGGNE